MSTLTMILFFGGYNCTEIFDSSAISSYLNIQSIILGIKTCFATGLFVWFRATLPRLRYDQLMLFCWTGLLPIAIGLTGLVPGLLIAWDWAPQ
jgi:NADH-ubiquinone oxidoreductase chain 1